MIEKTHTLRASLNRMLQPCRSELELRGRCVEFQKLHGTQVWFSPTGHNENEIFMMLAEEHLGRVRQDEEFDYRAKNILKHIEECDTLQKFTNIVGFVRNRKDLSDDWIVLDELQAKGKEFGHPDYMDFEGDLPE